MRISVLLPSTLTENVFVSAVFGALSALEALCDYALYKSTFYLLTYFTVEVQQTLATSHMSFDVFLLKISF